MAIVELPGSGGYYDDEAGQIVQYRADNPFSPIDPSWGIWEAGTGWSGHAPISPTPTPVQGPTPVSPPTTGAVQQTFGGYPMVNAAAPVLGGILQNPAMQQWIRNALLPIAGGILGSQLGGNNGGVLGGIPGLGTTPATTTGVPIGRRARSLLGVMYPSMPTIEDAIVHYNGFPSSRAMFAIQIGNANLYWAERYRAATQVRRRSNRPNYRSNFRRRYYPRRSYR